jgi:predicted O-methyltransferase YrrM
MFKVTEKSLMLTRKISEEVEDFHHHYHILYDIATHYPDDKEITYVEVGCYAGASACLLLQRPLTKIISIDLGHPISKEIAIENMFKHNIHNNKFVYLQGNSHNQETVEELKKNIDGIDILFIDGDHSFEGVINDYKLYYPLVKDGGYIVFDDYADYRYSPEVKNAVDFIVETHKGFDVIGAFGSEFGARGECPSLSSEIYERDSNEFVIKKI